MLHARHNGFRGTMYICRFRLKPPVAQKLFSGTGADALLDQLDACKSDEARRLLLGVSEKQTASTK